MIHYQTKEGLEKMRNDLHLLETQERQKIAKALDEARQKGDLSENAEYEAAKDDQGRLEARIAKLKDLIANTKVLDHSIIDVSKVSILATVVLMHLSLKKQMTYTIVPENESDVKLGKISVGSPIGKGLLGKKKGEKAIIEVPSGKMEFEVLDIQYPTEIMEFHKSKA